MADLPQPVRTAVIAITGTDAVSMVRFGPSNVKSAPAASAREATCITCACGTSLYAKTTSSTERARHSASSSASSTIAIPSG